MQNVYILSHTPSTTHPACLGTQNIEHTRVCTHGHTHAHTVTVALHHNRIHVVTVTIRPNNAHTRTHMLSMASYIPHPHATHASPLHPYYTCCTYATVMRGYTHAAHMSTQMLHPCSTQATNMLYTCYTHRTHATHMIVETCTHATHTVRACYAHHTCYTHRCSYSGKTVTHNLFMYCTVDPHPQATQLETHRERGTATDRRHKAQLCSHDCELHHISCNSRKSQSEPCLGRIFF